MFSKCSFALIRSAAIELVLMSVVPDCWLMVMLIAAPSLPRCSSELSTFKSADFMSGDGDRKAKLCVGDCCMLLAEGLIVADEVCGIIEMVACDVETGTCDKCEGGGML